MFMYMYIYMSFLVEGRFPQRAPQRSHWIFTSQEDLVGQVRKYLIHRLIHKVLVCVKMRILRGLNITEGNTALRVYR